MKKTPASVVDSSTRNGGSCPPAFEKGYLRTLLPTGISLVETCEPASLETLLAEERAVVASSVPKRAVEFATGRWCARQAMARMGIHGFPLLPNSDRAPVWPANIVGSITHTEGYCAAVAGRRDRYVGIGVDAEIDGRAGEELWSILFTIEEIDWLEQLPAQRRSTMATVLFSAKESLYKAQYSLTNAWLEFQSATVSVAGDSWNVKLVRPQGMLGQIQSPLGGRFAIYDRIVVTAIAIESIQVIQS